MSIWLDEFDKDYAPDAVIEDLLSIKGVADESWHNDVSPHFRYDRDDAGVELWFDAADAAKRETGEDTPRYRVFDNVPRELGTGDDPYETMAYEGADACSAVAAFLRLTRLPQAVGDKFAKLLRRELTDAEFREMRVRNREEPDSGICHSHDFCDANMPMAEALLIVTGCEPSFDHDAITELWNQAFDYAKAEHLTARRAR